MCALKGKTMATITKRTSASGTDFYQVQIRRHGYTPISKAFKKHADAKDFASTMDAKLINNELVNRDAIKHSIESVITQYINGKHKKPITDKSKTRLKYLQHLNELGSFTVKTLTPMMLTKWIEKRLEFNKSPTVYWYYCNLKSAMMWHALQNGYRQDLFQIAKCSTTVTARDRRISDDEIEKLHQAMELHMIGKIDEMKWAIEFAINTAMRAGEMLAFRWADVDLKERFVKLDAKITKTGTSRNVPLTKNAVIVLEKIKANYYKKDNEARVFEFYNSTHHLSRQFKIISEWAGITDLLWHYTRHEAASRLYERTVLTDVEIASITGHKDINVLARHYAHLRPQHLLKKLDNSELPSMFKS